MNNARLKEMMDKEAVIIGKYPYYKNILNNIIPAQGIEVFDKFAMQEIYRIESFNHFLDNIKKKQLFFSWPGKWEDDFDGAFVRTPIHFVKSDIIAKQSYNRDYFCQCWSGKESAVMWKNFSMNPNEYIMIVSTVDKIMKSIWNDEACGKYVGSVRYCSVADMIKESFFESKFGASCYLFNEIGMASTFLYKPDNLFYEKEIRFVAKAVIKQGQQKDNIMIGISGKPADYIDKIIIDPRADLALTNNIVKKLEKYELNSVRSSIPQKDVENAEISNYYLPSSNNYNLPPQYSFNG